MHIEVMPTLVCNLQCEQCDRGHQGKGPVKDILPLDGGFSIVQRVFELVAISDVFEGFVVSGGEPTTYPLLSKLLDFLRQLRDEKVEVKSNGFFLLSLPLQTVLSNHWSISVYQENISSLLEQMPILDLLKRVGIVDLNVISYFDDFDNLGDRHTGINPLEFCFMPTVIGNLNEIFPCCRALKIGRKTGNAYCVNVNEFTLDRLSRIITKTDLCSHCPRYMGSKKIDRGIDHEKCCSN